MSYPSDMGYFGAFGGRFVSEMLMPAVLQLEQAYYQYRNDAAFQQELLSLLNDYAGRPSPVYYAHNLTQYFGTAKIYFKRDELLHTGAHKINNVLGQILLASKLGKERIVAETGAGQHGVATATVCAKNGMQCIVYMGSIDAERQKPNVFRMKLLGADVRIIDAGSATLKDAMNEALREWSSCFSDTHYCIGSAAGPHPYPMMVRDFQSVIGRELREQMIEKEGRLPDALFACIGGGSNAIGMFHPFLDTDVKMYGVEAAGKGVDIPGKTAAAICAGSPGVIHGSMSYMLQTDEGQIVDAYSISAGLDYPGIGPEHAFLHESGRVNYVYATDDEALRALKLCATKEGIIPALEPSHALAFLFKNIQNFSSNDIVVVNICGRGDKDLFTIAGAIDKDI